MTSDRNLRLMFLKISIIFFLTFVQNASAESFLGNSTANSSMKGFSVSRPDLIEDLNHRTKIDNANKIPAMSISDFLAQCLSSHNVIRKNNGIPLLVLDARVTQSAQSSANYIASRPNLPLQHNVPDLRAANLGENLARGYPTCKSAIVIQNRAFHDF